MPRAPSRRALLVILPLLAAGCASGPSAMSDQAAQADSRYDADKVYRIGPRDQLDVEVWKNSELSVSVPVRPDGQISVPLVGDVQAGGRTPEEVAGRIQEALGEYVREPRVTVIVTEINSDEYLSRVRITGAVRQPVSISYSQGMTVLDLVLEAGGLTDFAAAHRTRLYRRVEGETQVRSVNLEEILVEGDLDSNVPLRPGDVVSVPERWL